MTIRQLSIILFYSLFLSTVSNGQSQQVKQVETRLMKTANANIEKYRKGDAGITFTDSKGNPLKNIQVQIQQQSHDFLLGCILFDLTRGADIYREELFKQRFKALFNFAVFPFYWPGYERTPGMTSWSNMLPVIDWCKANGITTKGHPLVWSCVSGVPAWLEGYTVAETEDLLKSRVLNISQGYAGKIDIWDVVNEPVNVKTWKNKLDHPEDDNDWGIVEPIPEIAEYVGNALHWANTGNPESTLIINEYQTIVNKTVRTRFDELITTLKQQNAPLSGIGIQAHEPRQEWFAPQDVWDTFELLSRHGLPLHITELHPQSAGKAITGGWREGEWTAATQAEFTDQFIRLCFGHPAVASVNFWGFSDRNIWLPGGGLVDEEYQPKPVYNQLLSLFNEEWRTNLLLKTDTKGSVSFRGFYGNYEVRITLPDGRIKTYPVHLRADEGNEWAFEF